MSKIALISCTQIKECNQSKAYKMYSKSELFINSYLWARENVDKIYILSAKYGLLDPDDIIEPYDETLKDKSKLEKKIWSDSIAYNLSKSHDIKNDTFVILAGKDYYEDLVFELPNHQLPLGRMRYGERIAYLKSQINNYTIDIKDYNSQEIISNSGIETSISVELHKLFNNLKRYSYKNINEIPFTNGIYILFEKGEEYGELDRIVRVGTHRSDGRLRIRLKQHFLKENKDDSIFRKNIGRAMLKYNSDSYLTIWNLDFKKLEVKLAHDNDRNILKEQDLEKKITNYMHNSFQFVCFEVDNKEDRLRFEEGIIAALYNDINFNPSPSWSGRYSPINLIRESGMWLVQGLDAKPLTDSELRDVKKQCGIKTANENIDDLKIHLGHHIENPNKQKKSMTYLKSNAEVIEEYIKSEMKNAKELGAKSITFVSGDINKCLGFYPHKHPQISKVMWQFKKECDEVLHTTPSGLSSTIKIKYYL